MTAPSLILEAFRGARQAKPSADDRALVLRAGDAHAERDVANQTCLRRRRNHSHALDRSRRRSTWMTIAWPGHPGPLASCGGTYGGGTPRAGKMLITQVAG